MIMIVKKLTIMIIITIILINNKITMIIKRWKNESLTENGHSVSDL